MNHSHAAPPGGAPPIVAIDCHAHVMRRDAPLAAERHSLPPRDVSVAEYIDVLDRHGISHGVLTAPSFYGDDNTLLLAALDREPDRLRGTVIVEPAISREAMVAMQRRGVVGIRLNWIRRRQLPDVTSTEYVRLFAAAKDLDWHVEIFLEGPLLASVLPRVRQTGVKIVLDHFGAPDPVQGVACAGFRETLRAVGAGDTWVKLSAPYRLGGVDPQPYVDALLRAGGPEQLVWASDWPWVSHENDVTYRECIDWLVAWVPDERVRRTILTETPATLFGFEANTQMPNGHNQQ